MSAHDFPWVSTASPADIAKALSPSTAMAVALNATETPVYPGTVSPAEKARRRKQGKAARAARRSAR